MDKSQDLWTISRSIMGEIDGQSKKEKKEMYFVFIPGYSHPKPVVHIFQR
jgi:hypothetical protein